MTEATTEVKTVFTLIDHASAGLIKVSERMEKLHQSAERAKMRVESVVAPKLAAFGLALGFGEMAHRMYEVGEAAADAKQNLAGAYEMSGRFAKAGDDTSLEKSFEMAEKTYEKLEKIGIRGVASTNTYLRTYQAMSPLLEKTRAKTGDILEVSDQLILRLKARGQSDEAAIMSATQLGNAIATKVGRPQKQVLLALHIQRNEWMRLMKLKPEKMWEEIYKRVEKTKRPLDRLFEGPGLAMIRLRNTADRFMRILGEPMMKILGEQAEKLVGWMQENRTAILDFARTLGTKVGSGLQTAIGMAKILAEHFKGIAVTLGVIMVAPTAIGAATTGAKFAAAVAGGISAVSSWAGGLAAGAGKLVEWGSTLTKINYELGTTPTLFQKILGAGAQGLAKTMAFLGQNMTQAFGPGSSMMGKLGGAFAVLGAGLAAFEFGTWLDEQVGISDAISNFARRISGRAGEDEEREEKGLAEHRKKLDAYKKREAEKVAKIQERATREHGKKKKIDELFMAGEATKGWKPAKAENNFDFSHSRFDIKQAFAEGFDPDRVAVAFTQDLAKIGEMRRQSGFSPVFGSSQ